MLYFGDKKKLFLMGLVVKKEVGMKSYKKRSILILRIMN